MRLITNGRVRDVTSASLAVVAVGDPRLRTPLLPAQPEASGYSQDVVILGDFGASTLERRTRTSPTGKVGVRYSLSIEADPVLNILSGVQLGRGPAEAIAELIRSQMRAITEQIKPSTLLKRKYAATALAKGKSWAVKRYVAARAKPLGPPGFDGKDAVFSDSGLLRNGIFVAQNPREGSFTINVPANRLDPTTFGKGFEAMVARLASLVPALSSSEAIINDPAFVRAVATSSPVVLLREWKGRIVNAYGKAIIGGARQIFAAFG